MRILIRSALTALILTGLVTVGIVTGQPTPPDFNPKDLPPDLKWVSVQGIPMVYSDQGKGDPLVIFTPYPFSTRLWVDLVKPLSASARVIVVEPPGLRAPSSMNGDFSTEHLLQICREFTKALGLSTVHVLGVGESGALAVAYGHHFPQSVQTVTSINGFESVSWSEVIEGTINYLKQSGAGGGGLLLSMGTVKYNEKSPSREDMDRLFVPLAMEEQRKAVQKRFEQYSNDIQISYILSMIPNVERRLLLLRSENDQLLPDEYVQRTRKFVTKQQVRFEIIPKAGHYAVLDQPQKVADLVRDFLSRYPISGTPSTQ
jgi:pimeloyl-ACP methyl ester carboxylesterase